jgi:hypothetical protein
VTTTKDEGERARQSRVTASDEESEPPIELAPLRFPAVRDAIEEKDSGHVEVDTPTGPRIVTFYRLSSLGWYYVVVADPERLATPTATFSARSSASSPPHSLLVRTPGAPRHGVLNGWLRLHER